MSTLLGAEDQGGRQFSGGDDGSCRADELRILIERIARQLSDAEQRQTATFDHMLARVEMLGAEARSYKDKVPAEYLPAFERIENGVGMLADRIALTHAAAHVAAPQSQERTARPHAERSTAAAPSTVAAPAGETSPVSASIAQRVAEHFANAAEIKKSRSAASADSTAASMIVSDPGPTAAGARMPKVEAAPVIDPVMANDETAWDDAAAEALVNHYQETLGSLPASATDQDDETVAAPPVEEAVLGFVMANPAPRRLDLPRAGSTVHEHERTGLLDQERDWLDSRFIDIAQKIEDVLARAGNSVAIDDLSLRFDQLEERFTSAFADLATRSDFAALRQVETQIGELTARFDDARSQLARLDTIEHALSTVMDRLADPRFDSALERASENPQELEPLISSAVEQIASRIKVEQTGPAADLAGIADAAAERVATRFADATAERVATRFADIAQQPDSSSSEDVFAIRQLIDQFVNERREGDEQTAAMLDTMQRAMIRVLDRVDALESSQAKAGVQDYPREQMRLPADAALNDAAPRPVDTTGIMAARAQSAFEANKHAAAQRSTEGPAQRPVVASNEPMTHAPAHVIDEKEAAAASASANRLRQDFIEDAKRAKLKADEAGPEPRAAGQTGSAKVTVTEPAAVPIGKPKAKATAANAETADPLNARLRTPSRKLLVSAIILMIAIPGVMMLMKKRSTAPAPIALEQVDEPVMPRNTLHADGVPGNSLAPVQQPQSVAPSAGPTAAAPTDTIVPMPAATTQPPGGSPQQSGPMRADGARTGDAPSQMEGPLGPRTGLDSPTSQTTAEQRSEMQPTAATAPDEPQTGGETTVNRNNLYRSHPRTITRGLTEPMELIEGGGRGGGGAAAYPVTPLSSAAPPAGITVVTPSKSPTLDQLARLQDRQATAQLSNQLGAAQTNALPTTMIPDFMRANAPEDALAAPADQPRIADNRRSATDLPPAAVGPLSLRLAAAKGDASAEFEVGARFAEGKGMPQNLAEAMRWYQRAAARGFAQAQYRVATFYERGFAVDADEARAKIWYQRAAEQGNVKAMHNLAVLSAGRTAKTPDYATAARWFATAAEHGLADSQFNLAVLYESGLGVAKDLKQAHRWLALAARQGDEEAKRRQQEMERAMAPADLKAAQASLDAWRPKQPDRVANDPIAAGELWKSRAVAGGEI